MSMTHSPPRFFGAIQQGNGGIRTAAWMTVTSDVLKFRYLFVPRRCPTVHRSDTKLLFVERKHSIFGDTDLVWARFLPKPSDAPTTKLGELFGDYDPKEKLALLFKVWASSNIASALEAAAWPLER